MLVANELASGYVGRLEVSKMFVSAIPAKKEIKLDDGLIYYIRVRATGYDEVIGNTH